MDADPARTDFEIVTLPIGNGWRVRISDGEHLQFVGGFDDKHQAEDWDPALVFALDREA